MPINTNAMERVSLFFDSYTRALSNFDPKMMAHHFMMPAMLVSDDVSTMFPESNSLEGLFVQGISFYKQNGIRHARPEIWSKKPLAKNLVQVKVKWKYFDANNTLMYDCDDHYVLKLDKHGEWKIQVMISVNERERMETWMASKNK